MHEDGYIHLTGRAKDMIIRGGENVYPREVEEFLYTHPKVAEVQVVGIPDERLGEVVVAWIRLKARQERHRRRRFAISVKVRLRISKFPSMHPVRGRLSDDGDGKDSEVQDARNRNKGARIGGGGRARDCLVCW